MESAPSWENHSALLMSVNCVRNMSPPIPVSTYYCTLSLQRGVSFVVLYFVLVRPFWLSPRQARVVPVVPKFDEYAKLVAKQLYEAGFESEPDLLPGDTMNKKIRNAQLEQWNYILGGWGSWVGQCCELVGGGG